jgi:ATP-grasp domain, R2K clade family 3
MFPTVIFMPMESSYEARSIVGVAMLKDIPIKRVAIGDLALHKEELRNGAVLPVGSVEYLRRAMEVTGIKEPENLSYHPSIQPYLGRWVKPYTSGRFCDNWPSGIYFVKPMATKLFTGFVYNDEFRDFDYDEHDREQLQELRCSPSQTKIWLSPVVKFIGEWRYYVMDGKIIGCARYDTEDLDEANTAVKSPSPDFANACCQAAWNSLGHAFALDIGVLDDGKNVVVELNDAWAIGLYVDEDSEITLSNHQYLEYLFSRWKNLWNTAHA